MARNHNIATRPKSKHAKIGQTNWLLYQKCRFALVVSRIDTHLSSHEQTDPSYICIFGRDEWPFRGHADDICGFNNNTIGT